MTELRFILVIKEQNNKDVNKELSCLFKNLIYIYTYIILTVRGRELKDILPVRSIVWGQKHWVSLSFDRSEIKL
jgi:hypothetical protein